MPSLTIVTVACEGDGDLVVVRRLLDCAGLQAGAQHVQIGKSNLDKNLRGFNEAAKLSPWLVLRDLDRDAPCPSELVASLLPAPAPLMSFRLAVRTAEAWLLADRDAFSRFFRVSPAVIPRDPESLDDPKTDVMNLARRSKDRQIRESVPVPQGMSGRVGPGYTATLMEYARDHWRPDVAARSARSLEKCLARLRAWS